ncbi:MAG: dienelactone hydrolase family protein [Alphaproteobacteria bacterium]|nr:dienelactone hydrolase family protein [Alphaproteobacteria bacterium]
MLVAAMLVAALLAGAQPATASTLPRAETVTIGSPYLPPSRLAPRDGARAGLAPPALPAFLPVPALFLRPPAAAADGAPDAAPGRRVPAVVFLHGCAGWQGPRAGQWIAGLLAAGHAVLAPASYAARGLTATCDSRGAEVQMLLQDGAGALRFLATRAGIDPARLFVMGLDVGAEAALRLAGEPGPAEPLGAAIAGAIALSPVCPTGSTGYRAPVLIIAAALDAVAPVQPCRDLVAQNPAQGPRPRLVELPGAQQGFDDPEAGGTTRALLGPAGVRAYPMLFDAIAVDRAVRAVTAFLGEVATPR